MTAMPHRAQSQSLLIQFLWIDMRWNCGTSPAKCLVGSASNFFRFYVNIYDPVVISLGRKKGKAQNCFIAVSAFKNLNGISKTLHQACFLPLVIEEHGNFFGRFHCLIVNLCLGTNFEIKTWAAKSSGYKFRWNFRQERKGIPIKKLRTLLTDRTFANSTLKSGLGFLADTTN